MASGIFGALAALGNFGNQVATADQSNAALRLAQQKDQQAQAERQAAFDLKRKEFDLKQQQQNAPKPLGAPYVATGGKTMQRFYDPVSKTISEQEVGGAAPEGDAEKYVRSLMAIGTPEAEARKMATLKFSPTPIKATAEQQKLDFWKSLGFNDEQIKRMAGVEGGLYARPRILAATGGEGNGSYSKQDEFLARQIANGDAKFSDVPAKQRGGVFSAMMGMGLTPGKPETTGEKQADDSARQLIPMVDNAMKMLQSHQDETGTWSAFKQHVAKGVYGAGVSPGKDEEKILQTVSFLQLLGVQPWTKTGRGKFIFEAIEPHLPKAGDSLGLTYQKLQTLRELLPGIIQKGGTGPQGAPAADDDLMNAK